MMESHGNTWPVATAGSTLALAQAPARMPGSSGCHPVLV